MPATGAAGSACGKAPRTGVQAQAPPSAKHTAAAPLLRGEGAHKQSLGGRKGAGAIGLVPRHGDSSATCGWDGRAAYNPVAPTTLRAEQLFSSGWFAVEQEQTRRAVQTVR